MTKDYLGASIPKLGFGLMRLPMVEGGVDIEQTKKMVDIFMGAGFTYFDTAYVYINGNSEKAFKACVSERYPRESFQLATKMPCGMLKETADLDRLFNEQLDRTGAGYFDFYLLHNIGARDLEKLDELDAWNWLKGIKEKGLAKHIGFSCHDSAENLDKILTAHPELEFTQLQINYADWESPDVQARLCFEVAQKHNVPVIVMEPVKGGNLASLTGELETVFKTADPDASISSWAIRYCASLEGTVTVLSGMSNIEQMEDNVKTMSAFKPLSDDDRKVIDKAVEVIASIPQIQCTDCKYCVEGCPQDIAIPNIFRSYNQYKIYQSLPSLKGSLGWLRGGKPSDCIECGLCEGSCPQHLPIIELLGEVAELVK